MKKKDLYIIISEVVLLVLMVVVMTVTIVKLNQPQLSAYDIAVQNGFIGSKQDWLDSLKGTNGKSSYELAVENGFEGTEAEWLASLQGSNGNDGENLTSVDTYQLYLTAKENNVITDENYTYLDFLRDYFSTSNDYSYAVAAKNLMSVVAVYAYVDENSAIHSTAGSGVILSLDTNGNAYVITNYHVTYYKSTRMYGHYKLYLAGTSDPISATYIGGSKYYDISVLKVENSQILIDSNAQAVQFREESAMLGEVCYSIGNTESKGVTLSKGVVSMESEIVSMSIGSESNKYRVIRHDTYIAHGSSGGALFDKNGYLIGVTNSGVSNTMRNYAIPAEVVKPLTENIINNYKNNNRSSAKVFTTGIDNYKIDNNGDTLNLYATEKKTIFNSTTQRIETFEKVFIKKIDANSLIAQDEKLKVGDEIISIEYNGILYTNIKTYTLNTLLLSSKSGDRITINATRVGENNETINVSSTIILSEIFTYELN